MTRVLLLAVIAAQVLDLVTWMAMPAAAEVNPIARGLHAPVAWVLKGLIVVAALGVLPALGDPSLRKPVRGRRIPDAAYSEMRDLVVVVAIFVGVTGFGSNLSVLSYR